jgi:hypothetical protein
MPNSRFNTVAFRNLPKITTSCKLALRFDAVAGSLSVSRRIKPPLHQTVALAYDTLLLCEGFFSVFSVAKEGFNKEVTETFRVLCVGAFKGTEDTARQSRNGRFQIQNSRP